MKDYKFINTSVDINDVEDRFKADEEITVQLKYCSEENKFYVTIPEAKKVEAKEEKAKPVNVYTGLLTGIKGTITVKGNAKLNMDMKPALIKALGKKNVKAELDEAFNKVVDEVIS